MKSLIVYGAGGLAREVAQLALDASADGTQLELVGFLSDDTSVHGTSVAGLPILGDLSFLRKYPGRFDVAIGVGAPAVKRRLALRAADAARGFPTLVHPSVVRSDRIQIGRGVIICAMTVLTVDITIGDFATINLACTVGHDTVLSNYVTLAPGVNVSGNVHVGTGCDIGTGAKIIQARDLGAWSIVGAGAVVNTDILADSTSVGVPARCVKQREVGWHLGDEE